MSYNCWAHARRYFFEAKENAPDRAKHVLAEIGGLYELERVLREAGAPPAATLLRRQEEAVPVLEGLKLWLEKNPGLPKSPWGKAVSYALPRWAKLCRYTGDGRIEIDNNLVENAIRPVALGRKNYLFAGSRGGAARGGDLLAPGDVQEARRESGDVAGGRLEPYSDAPGAAGRGIATASLEERQDVVHRGDTQE